jgi:hypothetical protein
VIDPQEHQDREGVQCQHEGKGRVSGQGGGASVPEEGGRASVSEEGGRASAAVPDEKLQQLKLKLQMTLNVQYGRSGLKAVLGEFDQNKDGVLSRKAFGRGLLKLDVKLSTEEKDLLLLQLDTDGLGKVAVKEFVRFVMNCAESEKKDVLVVDGKKEEVLQKEKGERDEVVKGSEKRTKNEKREKRGEKKEEKKEEEKEGMEEEGEKGEEQQAQAEPMKPEAAKTAAVANATEAASHAAAVVLAADGAVVEAIEAAADALAARRRWWEERHTFRQLSAQQRQQHPDLPGPELASEEQRRQRRSRERAQARAAVAAERRREMRNQEARARARFMHSQPHSAAMPIAARQMLWDSMMHPPGIRERVPVGESAHEAHEVSPTSVRLGSTPMAYQPYLSDNDDSEDEWLMRPPALDAQTQREVQQREAENIQLLVHRERERWRQSFRGAS